MNIVEWVTDSVDSLPTALVWALGALFSFTESGLGLGFFVPGETIVLLLAATFDDAWQAALFFLFVAVGGSLGDHVGYLLGRRFGAGFRDTRLIRRLGVDNWDRAVAVLERRGAAAVFLTRLVPVIRTLTPAAAGVARVPYARFLPASFGGALTWAAVYVGVGFLLRSSLDAVQKYLGTGGTVLFVVVAGVAVIVLVVRAIRKKKNPPEAQVESSTTPSVTEAPGSVPAGAASPTPAGPAPAAGWLAGLRSRLLTGHRWGTPMTVVTLVRLLVLPVVVVLAAAQLYTATAVVIGIAIVADVVDGGVVRRLRRSGHPSPLATWLDPVLDRVTVLVVTVAAVTAELAPWQMIVLIVSPDVLLAVGAIVAFGGDPRIRVWWAGRVRTALLLVGLLLVVGGSAMRLGGFPDEIKAVVGTGFALYLLGVVGHYVAGTHYARIMLLTWQHRVASATRPVRQPQARP
ncbi:DedA family protein [Frigoribacterium sp. 2-23]|uniref:DedA family protein n=1 Tax=Frigoribacterium sp. 2-23 TaxID=3415006 RepID=UPI003C6F75BF